AGGANTSAVTTVITAHIFSPPALLRPKCPLHRFAVPLPHASLGGGNHASRGGGNTFWYIHLIGTGRSRGAYGVVAGAQEQMTHDEGGRCCGRSTYHFEERRQKIVLIGPAESGIKGETKSQDRQK